MANQGQAGGTSSGHKAVILAGAFTLLAAVIGGIFTLLAKDDKAQPPTVSAGQSTTTQISTQQSSSASSSARTTTGVAADSGVDYLSNLKAITGDSSKKLATLSDGAGGWKEYPNSLRAPINSFNTTYTFEYNVTANSSSFRATLGIDQNSGSGASVHYSIYLDGAEVGTGYTVSEWQTQEINISVVGMHRIKLHTDVIKAAGVGNKGTAVWGNARFER